MRASLAPIAFALALGLHAAAPAAAEDATRTVQAELSGRDLERFSIENLVGTMRISTGSGPAVTVVATVHAETQALAEAVRLERSSGDGGAATLRVRYPYDKVPVIRYQEPGHDTDGFFLGFVPSNTYDYDGRRVRVSPGRGKAIHADLEVRVPAGRLHATFRNLVGLVEAGGLDGQLEFDVASADLRLSRLDGQIVLNGSSGDIRARDMKGSWTSEFSSGDCVIDGFDGEALSLRTSSGDLVLKHVRARRIETETSSGDVRASDAEVEAFAATATSGDVDFDSAGPRLRDVQIRTSSGDVSVRLPFDASFEVEADQSSGDMDVGFSDGTAVRRHDAIVGYHRGTGGARIVVRTSSGDLRVSPG